MSETTAQGGGFALSTDSLTRLERILAQYPTRESALMPALWIVVHLRR